MRGVDSRFARTNSSQPFTQRVFTTPGATAFVRIRGAWLIARDLVREISAALDAQYAMELPCPLVPAMDATLTICPPVSGILDMAALAQ